jgi:hypothetical protein
MRDPSPNLEVVSPPGWRPSPALVTAVADLLADDPNQRLARAMNPEAVTRIVWPLPGVAIFSLMVAAWKISPWRTLTRRSA